MGKGFFMPNSVRKIVMAAALTSALAVVTATPSQAQWYGRGWGWGFPIAAGIGLLAGAVASAVAGPAYYPGLLLWRVWVPSVRLQLRRGLFSVRVWLRRAGIRYGLLIRHGLWLWRTGRLRGIWLGRLWVCSTELLRLVLCVRITLFSILCL